MPYNPFAQEQRPRSPLELSYDTPPNPFQSLRMGSTEIRPEEPKPFSQNLGEVYQRQKGPATSAYEQWLSNAPDRKDYKPGTLNRIGAILSGAAAGYQRPGSGHIVAQDILGSKYRQAQEDYQLRGTNLKDASGLEMKDEDSRLEGIRDLFARENVERDNDRQERAALVSEESSRLQQDKLKNDLLTAGEKVESKDDGWTYRISPTGEVTQLFKTGRSAAEIQHDLEAGEIRRSKLSDQNNANSSARSFGNQRSLQESGFENQKELKQIPSLTDRDKPNLISASQQRVARRDAATGLLNTPKYSKLRDSGVGFNSNNDLEIERSEGNWYSGTDETKNNLIAEFERDLANETDKILNKKTGSNGINSMTRQVKNKTTGEVKTQISTDGGKTWKFEGE